MHKRDFVHLCVYMCVNIFLCMCNSVFVYLCIFGRMDKLVKNFNTKVHCCNKRHF